MNLEAIEQAWKKLADRQDLIGKEVTFDNRIGDTNHTTLIKKIRVEKGHVTIESIWPGGRQEPAEDIWFKIKEDREPHGSHGTIFCDLDDRRQIRIAA